MDVIYSSFHYILNVVPLTLTDHPGVCSVNWRARNMARSVVLTLELLVKCLNVRRKFNIGAAERIRYDTGLLSPAVAKVVGYSLRPQFVDY